MAEGWSIGNGELVVLPNTGRRTGNGIDPVIYQHGDPFSLNERFETPDYTDNWPKPQPGDDLTKNSGRFTGLGGLHQAVPDLYALQARKERLALVQTIERTSSQIKAAKLEVAHAAWEAMYAVTLNDGQRTILKRLKPEYIAYIVQHAPGIAPQVGGGMDEGDEEGGGGSEVAEAPTGGGINFDNYMNFFGDKVARMTNGG